MFFKRIVIRRRVIHPDKAKIAFKDGQSVSVMGRAFNISVTQNLEATYSSARIRDGNVKIKLTSDLKPSQQEKHVSSLARKAIAKAVLPDLEARVRQFNDLHFKAELGKIRIKDNVSNWGSCSRQNNINLDFRLLFGPQDILDAVILHELTHTKHRDHSRAFYDTLLAIMPDNKQKLRWLRDNGGKLSAEFAEPQLPAPMLEIQKPDKPIWALDS